MDKLLYTLHVMWYESKMLNETLDSVQDAITNSTLPVDVLICLNSQTYIEKPNGVIPIEMFNDFIEHPIIKQAIIIHKTDQDSFYNIGDWRRDIYGPDYDYKYIVWGESDSLVPEDHFFLLSNINIDHPHFISLATRKMWDSTWDEIEHPWIHQFPRNGEVLGLKKEQAPIPYNCGDYITTEQLNDFNRRFNPELVKLNKHKIDGNMTSLSKNLPYPFLPTDLHFSREDYCLEMFFIKMQIPQYHIKTRLKGHNTAHPVKRVGTLNHRGDEIYKKYEQDAYESIFKFINNI
jgi:hypothetical protein